MNFQMGQN